MQTVSDKHLQKILCALFQRMKKTSEDLSSTHLFHRIAFKICSAKENSNSLQHTLEKQTFLATQIWFLLKEAFPFTRATFAYPFKKQNREDFLLKLSALLSSLETGLFSKMSWTRKSKVLVNFAAFTKEILVFIFEEEAFCLCLEKTAPPFFSWRCPDEECCLVLQSRFCVQSAS